MPRKRGHRVIGFAVETSTGFGLLYSAPLLKEEQAAVTITLSFDVTNPFWFHRSRTRATFAPNDYPVNSREVDRSEILQQRFNAEKADGCRRAPEVGNARNAVLLVFNTDAPPNMGSLCRSMEFCLEKILKPVGAFGKDLVGVPVCTEHNVRDGFDIFVWNDLLKEIAHAIYENGFRSRPPDWIDKLFRNKARCKSKLVGVAFDATKPFSESFGVAVLATGADFLTTANGIPCSLGPFNFRLLAHWKVLLTFCHTNVLDLSNTTSILLALYNITSS